MITLQRYGMEILDWTVEDTEEGTTRYVCRDFIITETIGGWDVEVGGYWLACVSSKEEGKSICQTINLLKQAGIYQEG